MHMNLLYKSSLVKFSEEIEIFHKLHFILHKMLLLRSDTVNISTSLGDNDVHDLVINTERSLKKIQSLSTKTIILSDDKNFEVATCKKRKLSDSIFLTSIKPNKIQRTNSCSPRSKSRKCVRFDLSATTIHNLGRMYFSSHCKIRQINENIDEGLVPRNSACFSIESDPTLHNENQMKELMWYTRSELLQIKIKAHYASKIVQLDSELTESYNICSDTNNRNHTCDNILLQRLLGSKTTKNNSTSTIKSCNKLYEFIWQRGLERWSSIRLLFHRTTASVVLKTSFFIEQSEQMISGEKDPIKLANICHNGSVAANCFAQLLASIDAYDIE